jgi:conjugative relaxase-like TrwC/TraI family protein
MLSLSTVSASHAGSYFTQDDYYNKEQGQWQGKGAEALGLAGHVEKEDFKQLVQGRDIEGNDLVTNLNGLPHRGGTDATLSMPKSGSILWGVAGDERIKEAHEQAVTKALEYVEKHFSQVRITEGGITQRIDTGRMVIAKFTHETSRAQDPSYHTHSVCLNLSQRSDGEWRSLSNEKLYENKMLIGQIYRNELAFNLKALGYEIQPGKQGMFEVKGVDPALIKEFSGRREEILKALDGRESGGKLAEKVTLMTREAKPREIDRDALKQDWLNRAAELGYTREMIQEKALEAGRGIEKDIPKVDHLNEAIKSLEIQTSVWSREEMLKSALRSGLSEGLTVDRLEKQIDQALVSKELVQLAENKYSSLEAIKTEQKIVELVQNRQGTFPPGNLDQINSVIKEQGPHLNEGQQAAILHITGTQDGVVGVQGYAGVGKTTMLSVANQYWEKEGYQVTGLAYTGRAAELLQTEAGIKSQTIHSFLGEKEQANGIQAEGRQIWVVDEASMVGNRLMLDLLKTAENEQAKVVLIGDKLQLQAIDAGKPFQNLQEKGIMATAKVEDILRQKTEGLREVVFAVAKEMDTDKAIHLLDKMGAIKELGDRQERLMAIATDYLALSPKEMKNTLIVTARNIDRMEINQSIREGLKEKGQLNEATEKTYNVTIPKAIQEGDRGRGESYNEGDMVRFLRANRGLEVGRGDRGIVERIEGNELKVQLENSNRTISVDLEKYNKLEAYSPEERQFAHGDQVMFLRNDKNLGVVNGSLGMVVEANNHSLKVETRTGIKDVDLKTYNHIDHSYGSTLHKSQGMTSERVMIHLDTAQGISNSANAFYVGVSRASHEATIYTDSKENLPDSVRQWQEKESTQDYEKGKNFDFENGKQSEQSDSRETEIDNNRGVER